MKRCFVMFSFFCLNEFPVAILLVFDQFLLYISVIAVRYCINVVKIHVVQLLEFVLFQFEFSISIHITLCTEVIITQKMSNLPKHNLTKMLTQFKFLQRKCGLFSLFKFSMGPKITEEKKNADSCFKVE